MVNTVISEAGFLILTVTMCEAACGLKCLGTLCSVRGGPEVLGVREGLTVRGDGPGVRRAISAAPSLSGLRLPTCQMRVSAEMTPKLSQLGQAPLRDTQASILSGALHSPGAVTIPQGPGQFSPKSTKVPIPSATSMPSAWHGVHGQ